VGASITLPRVRQGAVAHFRTRPIPGNAGRQATHPCNERLNAFPFADNLIAIAVEHSPAITSHSSIFIVPLFPVTRPPLITQESIVFLPFLGFRRVSTAPTGRKRPLRADRR